MEHLLVKVVKNTEKIAQNTEPMPSISIILSERSPWINKTFNPLIQLDEAKSYEMALIHLYTYNSFPNIDATNNNFKYSPDDGATWVDIFIPEGCYELNDLDKYIQRAMKNNGHYDNIAHRPKITLKANNNTLKALLYMARGYKVDFSPENTLGSVLGFNRQVYDARFQESEKIVHINKVNSIMVTSDIIGSSYSNGTTENIIYSFFPEVGPGYKIIQEPTKPVYLPITLKTISKMETTLTDQTGKLLNLRGEELTIRFHIREIKS